jgi:cytochrome c-type biogenesis protein CcsB
MPPVIAMTLKSSLRRALGALCFLGLLAPAFAARAAELQPSDFEQWSLLAIQDNGRRKPLDTFAYESLLRLSGGSFMGMAVYKDTTGRVWQPNEFLLSILLSDSHDWKKEPLVLVNYRPLVQKLGLDATRKRFSFQELTSLPALETMARDAHALRLREREPQLSREQQEVESVSGRLTLLSHLLSGEALLIVPPPPAAEAAPTNAADAPSVPNGGLGGAGFTKGAWLVPPDANTAYGETKFAPVTDHLRETVSAYLAGDAYNFSLHARELRESIRALNPALYPGDSALEIEHAYNHLGALPWASSLYGLGTIALLIAAMARSNGLRRATEWTGLIAGFAGLLFHGAGIVLRCIVAGRPPVTNMYESMIWVPFVVTLLGYIFYARYRGTTYLLAALPMSCFTLLLVQQVPVAMPGAIEPLQPVLRDNFWLATHVLTETASYGAFALGMAFGHILLVRYIINPAQARTESALHFWLYRVLQLGVLLITIGTILGAVWANYSWGRFWGWDPKETWAFITLLCYIVAIHGRIAGWWGQFGLAVASVVCFAAVVMAWYGVNFVLGKGLHSYGRGIGGEGYVAAFLVFDAIFLAIACWRHLSSVQAARAARAPRGSVAKEVAVSG